MSDTPRADALARELVENDAHVCPTAEHPFWRLLELARELERKAVTDTAKLGEAVAVLREFLDGCKDNHDDSDFMFMRGPRIRLGHMWAILQALDERAGDERQP